MQALRVLLTVACAHAAVATQGPGRHGNFLVKAIEFKHSLRACNAYPYAAPLDVFRNRHEKLTDEPMPYKTCREFKVPLKAGDKLKFQVGDANAGTFSISDLPNTDATLLLVIHRHDTLSTAVSFESHVFAKLLNAQIAVIDTYKGAGKAGLRISEKGDGGKGKKSEALRYNSVVAVNPGEYDVVLENNGKTTSNSKLVALNRESYVIMRVGVEAQSGQSYPQEIVVQPKSDPSKLSGGYSGAAGLRFAPLTLLAVALCVFGLY